MSQHSELLRLMKYVIILKYTLDESTIKDTNIVHNIFLIREQIRIL